MGGGLGATSLYGLIEMLDLNLKYLIILFIFTSFFQIFNSEINAQIIFPKAEIEITYFELVDTNKNIIPAVLIGGKNEILKNLIYPEIAKRAGIEGLVCIEFDVTKDGLIKNVLIIKDIGGQCGEQAIKSVSQTKFIPGKLNILKT